MKKFGFLIFIGLCLMICAGDKKEMSAEDEKRLIQLYNESYKITEPAKLNAASDEILQILSGLNENTVTKACRIHAYSIRAFAAYLQKDRKKAMEAAEHALQRLPEIRNTDFYFKWAAELYSLLSMVHWEIPEKTEHWQTEMANLIEMEIKGDRYRHGSKDYRIMVLTRKYECLWCRAEYSIMRKNDLKQAEKLLLSGIAEMEKSPEDHLLSPLVYCCDLLCELYRRQKAEKKCRMYAEKCLRYAVKGNLLPQFADEYLYEICMKENDNPAALDCCRSMLKLTSVLTRYTKVRRRYLLRAADVCEKLNDKKMAEDYRAKAEEIKILQKKP